MRLYMLFFLTMLLFLPACTWTDQESPFEAGSNDRTIHHIRVFPARLDVEVNDYIDLDKRLRTLAFHEPDERTARDIKMDVWQKQSGIGSIVYSEFRTLGQTGEALIEGQANTVDGIFKTQVTIRVAGISTWPERFTAPKAAMIQLLRIQNETYATGATGDLSAADDEKPRHQVWLSPYWISEGEVTREAYALFLNDTQVQIPGLINPQAAGLTWTNGRYEVDLQHRNYPITNISWEGARAFCSWLGTGYRLPTEAEWEWAARGGTVTPYPWGTTFDATRTHVNQTGPSPVHAYVFNDYRLFDMMGNVREYCSDWYGTAFYHDLAQWNPVGPTTGLFRVVRGGGWRSLQGVRVSERDKVYPETMLPDLGFRVVWTP